MTLFVSHRRFKYHGADREGKVVRSEGGETASNNIEAEKEKANFSLHHSKPLC